MSPRSRQIDPKVLGHRIRRARTSAGLTQAQVAHPYTSTAYISRIEAGQRRPSDLLLRQIAARLGIAVDALLAEFTDEGIADLWLRGAQADCHLAQGDLAAAESLSTSVAIAAQSSGITELATYALTIAGAAAIATGRPDDAARILEQVVRGPGPGAWSVRAHALLCVASHRAGNIDQAQWAAERGDTLVTTLELQGLPESLTLATAYADLLCDQGDYDRARQVCREALTHSKAMSRGAQLGEALWHASVRESERGIYANARQHAEAMLVLNYVEVIEAAAEHLEALAVALERHPVELGKLQSNH